MKSVDVVSLFAVGIILGWAIGLMTNNYVQFYAGKVAAKEEARKEARQWAEEELKHHCVSWHTDRRRNDYMACLKPDWMRGER